MRSISGSPKTGCSGRSYGLGSLGKETSQSPGGVNSYSASEWRRHNGRTAVDAMGCTRPEECFTSSCWFVHCCWLITGSHAPEMALCRRALLRPRLHPLLSGGLHPTTGQGRVPEPRCLTLMQDITKGQASFRAPGALAQASAVTAS